MITKIKKEISCLFVSAIFVLCFHLEVVHIKVNNIFFFLKFLSKYTGYVCSRLDHLILGTIEAGDNEQCREICTERQIITHSAGQVSNNVEKYVLKDKLLPILLDRSVTM